MTNRADILEALAERVEKASVEEQAELIGDAWDAIGPITRPTSEKAARFARMMDVEAYESAAMTLVPEGMIWMLTNTGIQSPTTPDLDKASAVVGHWQSTNPMLPREAATPALAFAAACLRAHASMEKNNG